MKNRISDEQLEKALKKLRKEKYAIMIFDTAVAEKFVLDLQDARKEIDSRKPVIDSNKPLFMIGDALVQNSDDEEKLFMFNGNTGEYVRTIGSIKRQ